MTPRERILDAAATLLADGGLEAVSTRAVSAAASVQAPTIYRTFGDMRGLLDAVATAGFAEYLETKAARVPSGDPVEDLRAGWDLHVGFGLAHPHVYALIYGGPDRDGDEPEAARQAEAILRGLVERVAEAGRLTVDVERAVQIVHAAGMGVTLALIGTPADARDAGLSPHTRDAILGSITTAAAAADPAERALVAHAVALAAAELPQLTAAERALMGEWLGRVAR
ncbi:TetR/AcrR family transcriptional regulator [Microbacteriaceae bacterium VKM Ac-2854]|nr:TetR/AcrR family transcriptional regulator [Microbacteriaceae bacterium VKM Ac-2854]